MNRQRSFHSLRNLRIAVVLAASLVAMLTTAYSASGADRLEQLGGRATEGAAAGYVQDSLCANCHGEHYAGFQHVGMAQSFSDPANANTIETLGVEYFHAPSQRYYQFVKENDVLIFRRYQRDAEGATVNSIDIPVDWIIGSGNRVRSYLYATNRGELFLLPVSWFSQTGQWRMTPGFEHAAHQGVGRRIKRECMFCHNAFPEVEVGSDAYWEPDLFPGELPQGIGCQRCHGPGAEHIRSSLEGQDLELTRAAIVNPADFSGPQLDSVCFQCHLLPAVSVVGARRIDRNDYSFRPGQLLSDYLVHVDVAEQGVAPGERFEINHHAYRFTQSACYRRSAGSFSCINCHDPHRKPESGAFREETSRVCRGCHEDPKALHVTGTQFGEADCVTCHMPTRRTSDVVEVTMTDHRIASGPFDAAALVKPLEKDTPPVTGVGLLDSGSSTAGRQGDMYRMLAALRANRFVPAATRGLQAHLEQYEYESEVPYIDLARGQLQTGDFGGAESTARDIIAANPDLHVAHTVLGMAKLAQGDTIAAIASLQESLRRKPDPETHFNLAAAWLQSGDNDAAEQQIDQAIELRPLMAVAWKYKGIVLAARGETDPARDALIRSLQIEPGDASVYRELVLLLRRTGSGDAASRYLELGRRVAVDPSPLRFLD